MERELKELKSVLRSLVVSSPTEVDLRTLLRDYRNMMGEPVPLSKFGYRDGLAFIKEKCSDCFVVQDGVCNPVLTLIVPDSVKHIDKFVQKQKVSSTTKFKGKRRSVPEEAFKNRDLVARTFKAKITVPKSDYTVMKEDSKLLYNGSYNEEPATYYDNDNQDLTNGVCANDKENAEVTNGVCSTSALQNFMKKRIPMLNSSQYLDSDTCLDKDSSKGDTDSGRQTLSSGCSGKRAQLDELKMEIRDLIAEVPEGVWCTELMRLYRERYGRELNFSRFGFTSVLSLAYAVDELQCCAADHSGEMLLLLRSAAAPPPPPARAALPAPPARAARPPRPHHLTGDPDDALPGIDYDQDVFPADCMHLMQTIPAQSLEALAAGAMLQVVLGEVYSPTHFWMLRLGPAHYSAMEALMDEMNQYYRGEGRERALAGGAVRVGHYCACCYQGDWHRAVIVKIVDCDTVKVRHIDYATVESVSVRGLKPLRRCWAALPAQALRARLAGVRPPAAGRRWPWAAAAHFLALVQERRLVANVVAKDEQEGILEVVLIDTSTEEDVCIGSEMCRSGHADPRPDSALGVSARPDSSSLDREDMRSLLSTIVHLRPAARADDDLSEISASASELVGRGPRLIRTWAAASDRASDLASTALDSDDDDGAASDVSSRESVVRAGAASGDDGAESVLSAVHVRLLALQKLKKITDQRPPTDDADRSEPRRTAASSATGGSDDTDRSEPRPAAGSDGADTVCSAIEARMLKIRELKEKRPVPSAESAPRSEMVGDRCDSASALRRRLALAARLRALPS